MLSLLLAACAFREPIVYDTPLPVDDTFARRTPDPEALARYQDAAAYSEAHGGRALVVIEGDEVVFETGQNGHGLDEPHHLFSGTKSFSCALFAVAEAQGALRADQRVRPLLPELPPEARGLTVDHLLHLTSGVKQDFWRLSRDGMVQSPWVDDKAAHALSLPFHTPPGSTFEYGSAHFFLFGEVAQRALSANPLDTLEDQVFKPIGLRTAGWLIDPTGTPALSYGAFTTAHEWAKFGVLVRDDGRFLGEEVIPPGHLHACLEGSDANPAYGRTFWLNREVDDDVRLVARSRLETHGPILWAEGPADLVAAAGHDDQRLYIIPSRDVVVARLSDGHRRFRDAELLERLLGPPTDSPD